MIVRPHQYNYERPEDHDFEKSVTEQWSMWYVTCAHCVVEEGLRCDVTIEMNGINADSKWSALVEKESWIIHPDWKASGPIDKPDPSFDIAVAPAHNRPPGDLHEGAYWPAHWHLTHSKFVREGIVEGDEVYMVGYPLGLGRDSRNYPLVRHGVIAQCQPYIRGEKDVILIDAASWIGNSGGPIITKPAAVAIDKTSQYTSSSLLGLLQGAVHLEHEDDNTADNVVQLPAHLGIVVPTQTINKVIDFALGQTSPS